ncbi:ABC transporter permease [Streptomyces sp. GZWMJZ-114]|uniref:ABC transporter permease n=1 Tax=Streptomyces sp. GZWMJZ-114 TaxID=2494734 RepID=UPI0010138FD2|nr:ABC transporter permease [Streptomyces sp. GZWMJZ-114]
MRLISEWRGVFTTAARIGFREFTTFYTWRAWVFGWFLRLVAQVVFFGSIGLLVQSPERIRYMVIGNAAAVVCIEALAVITSTVRERALGTLALQVASPADYSLTYLGRGIYCLIVGIVSSTSVLFVAAAVFGLHLPFPGLLVTPALMLVTGASAYALGTAIGAVVMRFPAMQFLALNLAYLSLMTFCGVNVPVDYWSGPVSAIAQVLPLTHGLDALRMVLGSGSPADVLSSVGQEIAVGGFWLLVGILLLKQAVTGERRRGTIELSA